MAWRWVLPTVAAIAIRPRLWVVALRQARLLARPGWWRRPPFLPLPDRGYVRFRAQTMYGDPDHPPNPDDVCRYLAWCRDLRASGVGRSPSGRG